MLKQSGFSLIELMIAMAIGIFALLAISTVMTNNIQFGKNTIDLLKLNQTMRSTMNIISDDIRRAGYWNNASKLLDGSATQNPHAYPNSPVTIGTNCIIFSYDRDNVGDTVNDSEKFGYALINNTIYMRTPGSYYGCDPSLISSSNPAWQAITDPAKIKVTTFTFTKTAPTDSSHQVSYNSSTNICITDIKIEINAETKSINSIIKQPIQKIIRIRNDTIRTDTASTSRVCA
ncbi:prepilin-type N-terminal cleavage/methylation domain-containing protein [Chitinibacter sp. SCUT-21]|uniref:PilW family protein n=1 Tax=Chitinibacter sp. SCUT-21 TaxID=2970891 RepID=UPI0035A5D4DB